MKKLFTKLLICISILFTCVACDKTPSQDKFVLEGDITLTESKHLTGDDLRYMVEQEQSFVLIITLMSCSTCSNFFQNIVNPYIEQTHGKIYSIYSSIIDGMDDFDNKPRYSTNPTIVIYNEGEIIKTLNYKRDNVVFNSLEGFDKFMSDYVIKPNLIILDELTLDRKIADKESFILYIGWNKCGDCSLFESEVLNNFLNDENKTTPIYYLESDYYRINRPSSKPVYPEDESAENIEKYQSDLYYWNLWVNFTLKYNFNSYRGGRIPTIQYYLQGSVDDMLVYHNDVIVDNIVTTSFFEDLIGQEMDDNQLIKQHNKKALQFLNNYYK